MAFVWGRLTRWFLFPLLIKCMAQLIEGFSASSRTFDGCVVGLGSCGLDFVATVEKYPEADAKIRSTSFNTFGGGNVGNTLTCLARLGVPTRLATKVGADANGRQILQELKEEGVDVGLVLESPATPSAFTYILVDSGAQTRTCIHTPQTEDLLAEEVAAACGGGEEEGEQAEGGLLAGAALVHLDSRHTGAAAALAARARRRGVPVTVDAEKDRPGFRELLPLADVLLCNAGFPTLWTGEERLSGMAKILADNENIKTIVSTNGSEGATLLCKKSEVEGFFLQEDDRSPLKVAREDLGGGLALLRCPAWPVDPADVVDTTGAGDSFIGGFIFGLLSKMSASQALNLASYIAAQKLKQPGARQGLPRVQSIPDDLLTV